MSLPPDPSSSQPTGAYPGDPTPTGPYPIDPSKTGPFLGEPTPDRRSKVPGPRRIGRFELRSLLGQGGFGTVYRAYDPQLDREVALKVPRLPPNRPDLVQRFLREARAAARLRHPGIVAVFEAGSAGNDHFIASELVTGRTLRGRMDSDEPLTMRQAVGWVRDLALALEYAHGQSVIHRDIKPANIMIDAHNRAQLMDFGLAKRVDVSDPLPLAAKVRETDKKQRGAAKDAGMTIDDMVLGKDAPKLATNSRTNVLMTADGAVLGTPAYMSPEQAGGAAAAVGPHSDQYSLGVVLYELLTGRLPFEGPVQEVLRQVADPARQASSPRKLNPEVPPPLAAVCLMALAKEPAQRYRTAAELAVDLQRWLNGQSVRAYRRPGRRPLKLRGLSQWYREHQRLVLATALGLGLIGLLLSGTLWFAAGLRHQADTSRRDAVASRREAEAANRLADTARRAADTARCDLYRERGRSKDGKALRFLVESLTIALELEDVPRQQAVFGLLAEGDQPLPRFPGANGNADLRWDLAAHLLLGRQLSAGGEWQTLGKRLAHAGNARRTGFAAGGDKVLTEEQGQFRDARTGDPFGPPMPGEDVVFIPGGRRALCVSRAFRIWRLDSGDFTEYLGFRKPSHWGFSPDGTKIVLDGFGQDSAGLLAQRWDMTDVKALPGMFRLATSARPRASGNLAIDNDGSCVAMATSQAVHVWTLFNPDRARRPDGVPQDAAEPQDKPKEPSGRAVDPGIDLNGRRPIVFPASESTAVAFHPDGRHLLIARMNNVELWELSGNGHGEFLAAAGVRELLLSPQGGHVLTRGTEGCQLWDMHTRQRTGLPLQRLANVERVDFHPGGRQILTAADGDVRLWPNPVIASPKRPTALRQWAQAATGFDVSAAGDLQALDAAQRQECRRRFAELAGLIP